MKYLFRFLLYLLSAIPLLTLVLVLMVQVPIVNRWVLNKIIDITPGLGIQKIEGQLFHELTLNGITYQSESFQLNIDHLATQFSTAALFMGNVQFKSITIDGVRFIKFDHQTEATEDEDSTFILPVALDLKRISMSDIMINANDQSWQIDKVVAALHWFGKTININEFQVHSALAQIDLDGDIYLSENLPFNLQLSAIGNVQELGNVKGSLNISGNKNRLEFSQQIIEPYEMVASGSILLASEQPQMDLKASWQNLYWPLQGQASYLSNQGEITLNGAIDDYHLRMNGDFQGTEIPESTFELKARGSTEQMQINALNIDTLQGSIHGNGQLGWKDYLTWMMQFKAVHLSPEAFVPDISGDINFDILLSGNIRDQLAVIAEIKSLQGTLLNQELKGNGKISYAGETVSVDRLLLKLGENQLWANGVMGKNSKLVYSLDAENLAQLYPGLSGRIKADGMIKGDMKQPMVDLEMNAASISFEQYHLQQANLKGTLDIAAQGGLDLSIEAGQIKVDESIIESLSFLARGNYAGHRIDTMLKAEQGKLILAVDGRYNQNQKTWNGQVTDLKILESQTGDWLMKSTVPVNIGLQNDSITVNNPDLCINNKVAGGEICFRSDWHKASGQYLAGRIKEIPLNIFAEWLPEGVELDSQLDAQFDLTLGNAVEGELYINTEPGHASLTSDNQIYQLPLKRSGLQAKLSNGQLQSHFGVNFNYQDNISGDIVIADILEGERAEVNGHMAMNIADLSFLNALTSAVNEIQGKLGLRLTIDGPLSNPMLTAMNGSIQDAGFSLLDAGVSVNNFNFKAEPAGVRTRLKGKADLGGKALLLDGWIQKDATGQHGLDLNLKGKLLKVVQLANAEIWASPDLHLLLDREGMSLQGKIGIPKAEITIEELPEGAVSVSNDEIIINQGEPIEKAQPFNLKANILIKLGKEVAIQGHGLKTRLEGDLLAVYKKDQLMLYNELILVDGVYQSYGQDLTIEKGKLLFTGSLENPGISLLASRKSTEWDDNVVAYLELTGTLNDTKTKVYTKPALTESEALAYLLTGAPLDQASGSNSEMLAKAALSYGKDYIDGVMAVVGIDEFDIKSTQVGSSSMVLGKRITSKLFVRYIMDVLTSKMLFAVEYKLTKNISIETRTGDTHSSDIKYSIEFD